MQQKHPTLATAVCLSHTIIDFFKDVGNIAAIKVLLTKGQKIAATFKNQEEPRAILDLTSMEHLGRALGVVEALVQVDVRPSAAVLMEPQTVPVGCHRAQPPPPR